MPPDDPETIQDLKDSEKNLRSTLLKLGHDRKASELVAADIRELIDTCIGDLSNSVTDVPVFQKSNTNRRNKVSSDSQRVVDCKTEMEELYRWFSNGSGKPYKRDRISTYTLKAMTGGAPFGDHLIVAANFSSDPLTTVDLINWEDMPLRREVHYQEILSNDPMIRSIQRWRYRMLRGRQGQALFWYETPFITFWPQAFLDVVGEAKAKGIPVFYHTLEARLTAADFEAMAKGMNAIMGMMGQLFPVVSRSRMTVQRWSHGDPIFTLIRSIVDAALPAKWNKPVRWTRADKVSKGKLLENIAFDAVMRVQRIVDSGKTASGAPVKSATPFKETAKERADRQRKERLERLERAAYPHLFWAYGDGRSVLGTKDSVATRVSKIVELVLALRTELLAYAAAREVIADVCKQSFWSDGASPRAAADKVSGIVVPQVDKRMIARMWLLGFGYDNLEGETLKWFGHFDVPRRFRWRGADELYALATATEEENDEAARLRILELCGDLVADLHAHARVDGEALESWKTVQAWAARTIRGSVP